MLHGDTIWGGYSYFYFQYQLLKSRLLLLLFFVINIIILFFRFVFVLQPLRFGVWLWVCLGGGMVSQNCCSWLLLILCSLCLASVCLLFLNLNYGCFVFCCLCSQFLFLVVYVLPHFLGGVAFALENFPTLVIHA